MKPNTAILILATLAIAAGAYWYFFAGTGNEQPLSATAESGSPAQARFEALASELLPLSFDTSIFSDARFLSLVDLSTPITPETPGRLDPFAPLNGVSEQ